MTDLKTAEDMYLFYLMAEKKVLEGKSISKDGRTWTRENLAEIRKGRKEWKKVIDNFLSKQAGHEPGMALADFR